jgi:hypothetical protein
MCGWHGPFWPFLAPVLGARRECGGGMKDRGRREGAGRQGEIRNHAGREVGVPIRRDGGRFRRGRGAEKNCSNHMDYILPIPSAGARKKMWFYY